MTRSACVALVVLLGASSAACDDWPQWRGADGTGVSHETGWGTTGTEAWRAEVGYGHSSFAIVNGRLYTLGHDPERGVDIVWCLDAANGTELWRHEYGSEFWNEAHDGGTCTTPAVVDGVVYTSNREGNVFALDAADGNVRWQRELAADLDLEPPQWGFSGSPLLIDGTLFVNMDHIVALDATTGATTWSSAETYGSAYGTPAAFTFGARPALAVHNGRALAVLDRETGDELYEQPWGGKSDIHCSTPVIDGDRVFVSAGYGEGCTMYDTAGSALEEDWSSMALRTKLNGAILQDGQLYGLDNAILKCLDADGTERWRQRGLGMGAFAIADDRLIIMTSRGELVIAAANPDGYKELAREKVLDGGTYWTTPVISDGRIYCRNSTGTVVCRSHRGTSGGSPALAAHLPDAAELFERHEVAAGGHDAIAARQGLRMTGTGERRAEGGMSYRIEVYWSPSDHYRWVTIGPWMDGERAFDGARAWLVHPFEGPKLLEDEAREAIVDEANFDWELDWRDRYAAMTTIGRATFDGRDCWEVEAITIDGRQRRLWFEVASGLHAGQEDSLRSFITNDYRAVDGTQLPHYWAVFAGDDGLLNEFRFDTIEVGPVPDEHFTMPESVSVLTLSPEAIEEINAGIRAQYADYIGTYAATSGPFANVPFDLGVKNGNVGFLTPDGGMFGIVPVEGDHFVLAVSSELKVDFERNEAGAITGYRFTDQNGEVIWYERR